ncbi:MAG: hypothetical protein DRI99_07440 [Candidatus Aminicenantes bacterium]|nr:MAG: hypothetical protein DRI99_07440 [Candidatus Aminicenantes bacterium]
MNFRYPTQNAPPEKMLYFFKPQVAFIISLFETKLDRLNSELNPSRIILPFSTKNDPAPRLIRKPL